jgi:hypothetical protein
VFRGDSDSGSGDLLGMTRRSLVVVLAVVGWIFKTGYRIKA